MVQIILKNKSDETLYTTDANSYVDAMREATKNGVDLTNLCIDTTEVDEDLLWNDCSDLQGLNIPNFFYSDDRPLERCDNTFIDMDLCGANISLYDIEDGYVEYHNCNLCSASLSGGFSTKLEKCVIDSKTILPSADNCNTYEIVDCDFQFNDGDKIKVCDITVCFSGVRDKYLEKCFETIGAKVVSSMTKAVNVLIVKDINSSTSKIIKARENGVHIIQLDEIKNMFSYMYNEDNDY